MSKTSHSLAPPDGSRIELTAQGNQPVILSIVEEFACRFVHGSKVLFLRNATENEIVADTGALQELGVVLPEHEAAPDVVIHDTERDWLFLIDAVTSRGPIDEERKNELKSLFGSARPGLIFVTAFPERESATDFLEQIAWETEVWIADAPDHMIHFNGERFLGPYA
jgi:adenine-specific DNA-methyltransferase